METKSIEELIKDLGSPEQSKRIYAIEDLSEYKDSNTGHIMIDMLMTEKSQLVREAIVDSLIKMISPELFENIYRLFESDDAFTRNAAIMIFSAGGDITIDFLVKEFPEANNDTRKLILDSLFEIGSPFAIKGLQIGLQDRDLNVLISSIEYLGRLCDTDSGSRFVEILKNAKQPMLIKSLLRSISITCDQNLIQQTIGIMIPERDYINLNILYLGEILNLIGKAGNITEIQKILETNYDYNIYSEEISGFLLSAIRRYNDILSFDYIRKTIMKILISINVNNNTLVNIYYLIEAGRKYMKSPELKNILLDDIVEEKINYNDLCQLLNREWYGTNA